MFLTIFLLHIWSRNAFTQKFSMIFWRSSCFLFLSGRISPGEMKTRLRFPALQQPGHLNSLLEDSRSIASCGNFLLRRKSRQRLYAHWRTHLRRSWRSRSGRLISAERRRCHPERKRSWTVSNVIVFLCISIKTEVCGSTKSILTQINRDI